MKKLQDEFSKWNKSYIFLNSKLKSCSQNWFLKSYLLLNWNEHDVFKAGKVIHLTLNIHNMRWQREFGIIMYKLTTLAWNIIKKDALSIINSWIYVITSIPQIVILLDLKPLFLQLFSI